MSNIGEILRNNRESNNLTLKQLAEISGVGPSTISDIENGKAKHPRMDTLEKLASAFQISVNDFFDNKADSDKKLNNKNSIILTEKDRRDIEKKVEATKAELEKEQSLMLSGYPVEENEWDLIKNAIRNGLEYAKKVNKEKYTPKKYKK